MQRALKDGLMLKVNIEKMKQKYLEVDYDLGSGENMKMNPTELEKTCMGQIEIIYNLEE